MPFEEIRGQKRALRIIENALRNQCIPHAYLFYGLEGAGRFTTALALSKALLCKEKDADFCGLCSTCLRIDKEGHPDVFVVRPQSRKGGKEWVPDPELGIIRIEQIRELQRWIAVRGFEGSWRVVVLDGAEKMNTAASNALLKTLEEPPPHSLLILVSPNRTQLLPTVVSRCQPVHFSAIPQSELTAYLSEQKTVAKEEIPLLVALAQGSFGKARHLDSQWVFNDRRQWLEQLHALMVPDREGPKTLMAFAETLVQSVRLHQVLDLFTSWFKDLLFYSLGDGKQLINQDYIDEIETLSATQGPQEWISRIECIKKAKSDLQYHLNKQLVIEELLIKMIGY